MADEHFVALFDILTALQQDQHPLGNLAGNDTLDLLRSIAGGSGWEAILSKTILNYYYVEPYNYQPEFYQLESPRHSLTTGQNKDQKIILAPNPANDQIQVHLTYGSVCDASQVYLSDLYGEKIDIGKLNCKGGIVVISTDLLKNGIYFIHVKMPDSDIIAISKLVIVK